MNYKLILSIFVLVITAIACSDLNDSITVNKPSGIHPEGFGKFGSDEFHSYWFKENAWDIQSCQSCHGRDYSGGNTGSSCLTCHTNSNGPEQCNTCHGAFADPAFIAPPQDLADNTEPSEPGVGAHYNHFYNNTKSEVPKSCFDCHIKRDVPDGGKYIYAHIHNGGQAEILFGDIAKPIEDHPNLEQPVYTNSDLKCANTYCHGNFDFNGKIGNNVTVTWNNVGTEEATCGTCHGQVIDGELTPLPVGHFGTYPKEGCVQCHGSMVDDTGTITDKSKHINKEIDMN